MTTHSYFVVMQDLGRYGLEAMVQPEITRREVVSRIRSGDYKNIVFIHHVHGLEVEDLTSELLGEVAEQLVEMSSVDRFNAADRQAQAFDHARRHRDGRV